MECLGIVEAWTLLVVLTPVVITVYYSVTWSDPRSRVVATTATSDNSPATSSARVSNADTGNWKHSDWSKLHRRSKPDNESPPTRNGKGGVKVK